MHPCQSTRNKLNIKKPLRVDWARHHQLALGQFLETNPGIVRSIANKNHKRVALRLRTGQAFLHESQSDTEVLPLWMHHQGTKQQGWRSRTANGKRPKTYGSRQANVRIADNQ